MAALDQADLRVLNWRIDSMRWRIGQVVLVGGLCWLSTRAPAPLVWMGATSALAVVDWDLSRRLLARPHSARLGMATMVSRILSAASFSAVCFIVLMDRSSFGLAAAVLMGCAVNLNNAMMTRGSRAFAITLVGPSGFVLLAIPLVALTLSHHLSLTGALLLLVGTSAYVMFIASLAATLHRECEALRLAVEGAEASSRAKSAFLAMASHEIRTPLNGVLGMAQVMEHDPLPAAQKQRLAVIRQSGEGLLRILNDILDLSKIEAGKLELETEAFDLEAMVLGARSAFRDVAEAKGLGYGLRFDPAARGRYDGDETRVRQVLGNLISNALKFTEAGEVEVAVDATAGGVRLSVRDTGPGVAADRLERLFEKFVQADSSTTRRFGGTGLGLAICRELCEAMGGTIDVASAVGQGSMFTVELPLARSAVQTEPAPATDALAALLPPPTLRVLAAEDNLINQLVLRTLLQQIGLEPVIVATGLEAVRAWEEGAFDIILMDVQMPEMDGPTAARIIRERERTTGRTPIPIVALTANAMSHQVAEYLEAGMDAFVAKPIEIAALYGTIARFSGEAEAGAVAAA